MITVSNAVDNNSQLLESLALTTVYLHCSHLNTVPKLLFHNFTLTSVNP